MYTKVFVKNSINMALNKNGEFGLLSSNNVLTLDSIAEAHVVCKEHNLEIIDVTNSQFYNKEVNENQVWLVEIVTYEKSDYKTIHDGENLTVKELIAKLSTLDQDAITDVYSITFNKLTNDVFINE